MENPMNGYRGMRSYFDDKPSHRIRSRCMPLLHFLYPDFPNTPLGQLPQLSRQFEHLQ